MDSIKWNGKSVSVLDQRKLPTEEIYNTYTSYRNVAHSITDMEIRGAPAIGIAAAMGIALAAQNIETKKIEVFKTDMAVIFDEFAATRPTAVNLFWAIDRMKKVLAASSTIDEAVKKLEEEAKKIHSDDIEINKKIGSNGAALIEDGDTVLTHCNAGALATGGYGTALGVIRAAVEAGKTINIFACETRPYLQGARLTSWELFKDNIPVTLITDNMAGHFMQQGIIKKIVVGADRIAANGDTANKIGTYTHAVTAKHHSIPFYVAAPVSTFDLNTADGKGIPIEQRNIEEVVYMGTTQIAPEGISVQNPAFDVTPAELIQGIITEKGVIEEPSKQDIPKFINQ